MASVSLGMYIIQSVCALDLDTVDIDGSLSTDFRSHEIAQYSFYVYLWKLTGNLCKFYNSVLFFILRQFS